MNNDQSSHLASCSRSPSFALIDSMYKSSGFRYSPRYFMSYSRRNASASNISVFSVINRFFFSLVRFLLDMIFFHYFSLVILLSPYFYLTSVILSFYSSFSFSLSLIVPSPSPRESFPTLLRFLWRRLRYECFERFDFKFVLLFAVDSEVY